MWNERAFRATVLLALSAAGCVHAARGPASNVPINMTVMEAREALPVAIQQAHRGRIEGGAPDGTIILRQDPLLNVSVRPEGYSYIDGGIHIQGFSDQVPYSVNQSFSYRQLELVGVGVGSWGTAASYFVDVGGSKPFLRWKSQADAQRFADALNRLIQEARGMRRSDQGAEFAAFQQKAKEWRALRDKPPLPEPARRQKLLAEDAVQEKSFEKALGYYEKALSIEPCWPEGNFNAALIAGELKSYSQAIGYMKRYLELVPDAEDAPAARDKIIVWESK